MFAYLEKAVIGFKEEISLYKAVMNDKETPFISKTLLGLAIGYVLMPFDLIPDFIPVLGQIDDLIIVPILVILAKKTIPSEILNKHRRKINEG